MKQPNDTQTPDMHEDGLPAFDLEISHESPWPMSAAKPWTPAPRELTLGERMKIAVERWQA